MLVPVIFELLWSVPLIALCVFGALRLLRTSREGSVSLSIILGTTVGITCAVALPLIAGPMVSAVIIPLLPLFATIGAITGLLYISVNRQTRPKLWHICVCLAVVAILWIGFYFARNYVAEEEAFRVVVVKRSETSGPVSWDIQDSDSDLTAAERAKVEGLLGTEAGTLTPVSGLVIGKSPHAAAILVMSRDVSQPVVLRMPDAGTAVFAQGQDGKWREDSGGAVFGKKTLVLQPNPESYFTLVEVGSALGTHSFEVGISHK